MRFIKRTRILSILSQMTKNFREKVQYVIKLERIYYLSIRQNIFINGHKNVHVDPDPTDAVRKKFTSWIRILNSDYGSADPEELFLSIRTLQPSC